MIAGIRLHNDIEPVIDYMVADRDKEGRLRPEVVALGGPAGRDLDVVEGILSALATTRPDIHQPLASAWLSLAPNDRRLTDREWRDVGSRVATTFGSDVWATWRHGDDHVHVVWSRVRLDRTVVDHRHDYRRCEQAVREIEHLMGLEAVIPSPLVDPICPRQPRRPPEEDAAIHARYKAAWAAWQDSVDELGGLVPQLGVRGVQVTLDEHGRFCVVIGTDRIRPLVSVLSRMARREGRRPPREQDVLHRLHGISASVFDHHLTEEDEPIPVTTIAATNEHAEHEDPCHQHGVASAPIGQTFTSNSVSEGRRRALGEGPQHFCCAMLTSIPGPADQHPRGLAADQQRRRTKSEKERRLLAQRHAELLQLLDVLLAELEAEATDKDDRTRYALADVSREIERVETEMRRDVPGPYQIRNMADLALTAPEPPPASPAKAFNLLLRTGQSLPTSSPTRATVKADTRHRPGPAP